MTDFRLCAFADEASGDLAGQIEALRRNGMRLLEIRNVGGKTVTDLSDEELDAVAETLHAAGIEVWSVGSPLGKTRLEDAEENRRRFERSIEAAKRLGAARVRMFSYYVSEEEAEGAADAIFSELRRMAELAEKEGVILCHENEKGIFGSTAERTLRLLEAVPSLGSVFDPANYIQCGERPDEIFPRFAARTTYLHIKDALAEDGTVVPSGEGDGGVARIIDMFAEKGSGRVLTLEPHLFSFIGLKNLQTEELRHKFSYSTPDEAFDAGADALKKILDRGGYSYE